MSLLGLEKWKNRVDNRKLFETNSLKLYNYTSDSLNEFIKLKSVKTEMIQFGQIETGQDQLAETALHQILENRKYSEMRGLRHPNISFNP